MATFWTHSRRPLQVALEQIGVDVQRHRRVGMPQHPLHHLRCAPAEIASAPRCAAARAESPAGTSDRPLAGATALASQNSSTGGAQVAALRRCHSRSSRPFPAASRPAHRSRIRHHHGAVLVGLQRADVELPATSTALRCNSMRRRRKSMSHTRSPIASPQRRPPTPSSRISERTARLVGEHCSCGAVRYTFRRGVCGGSGAPRAGLTPASVLHRVVQDPPQHPVSLRAPAPGRG